jgi:hypothetical protein
MNFFKIAKPSTDAQKSTQTTLETIEVTPKQIEAWRIPPFQRPLRINEKVMLLAQQIKRDDGVIPGVMTVGVLNKEQYLIDGQHRRQAFLLSECIVGYVDVRTCHFDDMAAMGEEFVNLNSRLVNMRPDDILRGLEDTYAPIARIRKRCQFVGYDQIRRSERSPMLSMSALLRCWGMSAAEVPRGGTGSALARAKTLAMEEAEMCIDFLQLAFGAWGRDSAYSRLWLNLNLTLCMWLYRRLVITPYSTKTVRLTKEQFGKCLMSLSADSHYLDWLVGRNVGVRDMSPAYAKIKTIFATRLQLETGRRYQLPQPAWAGK